MEEFKRAHRRMFSGRVEDDQPNESSSIPNSMEHTGNKIIEDSTESSALSSKIINDSVLSNIKLRKTPNHKVEVENSNGPFVKTHQVQFQSKGAKSASSKPVNSYIDKNNLKQTSPHLVSDFIPRAPPPPPPMPPISAQSSSVLSSISCKSSSSSSLEFSRAPLAVSSFSNVCMQTSHTINISLE